MKRNLILMMSFAVILAFVMPVTTNAQTGKVNFSGNWVFNASKSNLGQAPQGGGGTRGGGGGGNMVAKQDGNVLTVETSRTNQSGETVTNTSKYTLDGKESTNAGAGGRGESKSVAKWAADGRSLTITTTRSFNDNTFTTTEVWSMPSANSLEVKQTMNTQQGERTTTRVYDKK